MLHWGGRGRATCMGKRPLERGSTRGSVCVCVCVCVCMHTCSNHGRYHSTRGSVCVYAHMFQTVADTALLFRLCHPPHQNVGWEWRRHLGLCNDGCSEESPLPPSQVAESASERWELTEDHLARQWQSPETRTPNSSLRIFSTTPAREPVPPEGYSIYLAFKIHNFFELHVQFGKNDLVVHGCRQGVMLRSWEK